MKPGFPAKALLVGLLVGGALAALAPVLRLVLAEKAFPPEPPQAEAPAPAAQAPEAIPSEVPAPAAVWDLAYGAYLAEACLACHGAAQAGVPALDGRPAEDLRAALDAYASGARAHDQMGAVARSLTPEERGHVAAFFSARAAAP